MLIFSSHSPEIPNDSSLIIIPVNTDEVKGKGVHWVLLIFDSLTGTFYHINSIASSKVITLEFYGINLCLLSAAVGWTQNFQVKKVDSPIQEDSWNCGCYLLENCETVLQRIRSGTNDSDLIINSNKLS